eukprot:1151693-Pelagomonas_calceolata.AAC.5
MRSYAWHHHYDYPDTAEKDKSCNKETHAILKIHAAPGNARKHTHTHVHTYTHTHTFSSAQLQGMKFRPKAAAAARAAVLRPLPLGPSTKVATRRCMEALRKIWTCRVET